MSKFAFPGCNCDECNDARRARGEKSYHGPGTNTLAERQRQDDEFWAAERALDDDELDDDRDLDEWKPTPRARRSFKEGPYAYIDRLFQRGFTQLGNGAYATVLAKPDAPYVIKVGNNPRNDAWLKYATWCYENPGPFRPVVRSIKFHDTFFVAVLERCECTLSTAARTEYDRFPLAKVVHRVVDYSIDITSQIRRFSKVGMEDVSRFLTALREAMPDAGSDLHGGNWMYRADGALILTDPFCAARDVPQTRIKADMSGYQYKLPGLTGEGKAPKSKLDELLAKLEARL